MAWPEAGWLAGPFLACCLLLVRSGSGKWVEPSVTGRAADAIGLPGSRAAVRTLAAVEVAAGIAGVVVGGAAAAAVAVVFAALAGVAWRLTRHDVAVPCGCLGATDTPVSFTHIVVNLAAAACALGAIGLGAPWRRIPTTPLLGLSLVISSVTIAYLVEVLMEATGSRKKGIVR